MKQVKEVERRYTQTITDFIRCEICYKQHSNIDDANWSKYSYGIDKIIIRRDKGTNSPSGGYIESIIADVCPDCFEMVVIPVLKSIGIKLREEEIDW